MALALLRRFGLVVSALIISAGTSANGEIDVLPAPTGQLNLEIGKSLLVHVDRPAESVYIADPKVADVQVRSPQLIYIVAKATGVTTLVALDSRSVPVANLDVAVRYDESQLTADLKELVPNANLSVHTVNNALVLTGEVDSPGEEEEARDLALRFVPDADHLLNRIRMGAPAQINLRVRVAEVSRQVIKAFGVSWGGIGTTGQFQFGLSTGNGATASSLHLGGVDNLIASYKSGNVDINAVVDALESRGLVTVLAEPNLTAVSGATASFLAGGEYPIPVPQGLNQVTIDYKKFGVSLSFVATLVDGGRINLQVRPEVSQLSTNGAITLNGTTVPALTTRRAETTVDLASGQSFAIAGLIQNNVTQDIHKFPGLGNVPVLGALFRSDRFERDELELVVIVTPYVVRPVATHRLATPLDTYVAPTDADRMLLGLDHKPRASALKPATETTAVMIEEKAR